MLTREQKAFFVRNGFLQLRQIIAEEHCAQMVEWTNSHLPSEWNAANPSTWEGRVTDACHSNALMERRGRLVYRVEELQSQPALVETYGKESTLASIAAAMIAGPLAAAKLRGLYPIFPIADEIQYPPYIEAHNEAHPSQIITVGYLNDVGPGGGGLLVWPGSHRAIYATMSSKLDFVAAPGYQQAFDEWEAREPIELTGTKGDVILLHHRLLHAPSVNRSSNVRYAFLCDYRAHDFLKLCSEAPSSDLWEDWNVADLSDEEKTAPADFTLKPQGHARSNRDGDRLQQWVKGADAAMKRKGDASILERMRRPGDRWLILSDSEVSVGDPKLFPRGSSLTVAGTRVSIDGCICPSICQYDYFIPLADDHMPSIIKISQLATRAWLRMVVTRLPLNQSNIEFCIEIPPGRSVVRISANGDFRVENTPFQLSRLKPALALLASVATVGRFRKPAGGASR